MCGVSRKMSSPPVEDGKLTLSGAVIPSVCCIEEPGGSRYLEKTFDNTFYHGAGRLSRKAQRHHNSDDRNTVSLTQEYGEACRDLGLQPDLQSRDGEVLWLPRNGRGGQSSSRQPSQRWFTCLRENGFGTSRKTIGLCFRPGGTKRPVRRCAARDPPLIICN